jgi:hypothetical protein
LVTVGRMKWRHVSGLAPGAPVARASRPGLLVGRLCEFRAAREPDYARSHLAVDPRLPSADRVVSRTGTVRPTRARTTRALAPLRPDRGGVQTSQFRCQRRHDRRWDHVGLHSADREWNGAANAGNKTFAANRSTGRDGVQGAEPEFRKRRRDVAAERATADGPVGYLERNGFKLNVFAALGSR